MRRHRFQGVLQAVLVGGFIGIVEPVLLHRLWWDRHQGSQRLFEKQLPWYLLGSMAILFLGYLVRFYIKEYWHIFVKVPQEEHNGIQR